MTLAKKGEGAQQVVYSFGAVEEAEVSQQRRFWRDAIIGAPQVAIVIGRRVVRDIRADRDQFEATHAPGGEASGVGRVGGHHGGGGASEQAVGPFPQRPCLGKEVGHEQVVECDDGGEPP